MSDVSEERTEILAGDVTAVRDVGEVAVTTGVGELVTGQAQLTSAISDVCE